MFKPSLPPDSCSTTSTVSRRGSEFSTAAAVRCRNQGNVGERDRIVELPTIDFRNSRRVLGMFDPLTRPGRHPSRLGLRPDPVGTSSQFTFQSGRDGFPNLLSERLGTESQATKMRARRGHSTI